jgi:c-di-GMP-related signal transduction protein
MNLHVVAEGVETVDQLQTLHELGCDYAQGFYFSKPVGSHITQALMREREELKRAFSQLRNEVRNSGDFDSPDAPVSCLPGSLDEKCAEVAVQS